MAGIGLVPPKGTDYKASADFVRALADIITSGMYQTKEGEPNPLIEALNRELALRQQQLAGGGSDMEAQYYATMLPYVLRQSAASTGRTMAEAENIREEAKARALAREVADIQAEYTPKQLELKQMADELAILQKIDPDYAYQRFHDTYRKQLEKRDFKPSPVYTYSDDQGRYYTDSPTHDRPWERLGGQPRPQGGQGPRGLMNVLGTLAQPIVAAGKEIYDVARGASEDSGGRWYRPKPEVDALYNELFRKPAEEGSDALFKDLTKQQRRAGAARLKPAQPKQPRWKNLSGWNTLLDRLVRAVGEYEPDMTEYPYPY